jgi:hypothetical protein
MSTAQKFSLLLFLLLSLVAVRNAQYSSSSYEDDESYSSEDYYDDFYEDGNEGNEDGNEDDNEDGFQDFNFDDNFNNAQSYDYIIVGAGK